MESPSFSFGDSAADELLETIMAATAQYGRKGNREQVLNRMRARLEMGYWTFPPPPGYRFERHPLHKKVLVPTEAARRALGPALDAFGRARLLTQRDMGVFLQEQGFWADRRPATVTGCLAKGIYPRYMCYWQQCPLYGHSYSAREKVEPAFVGLLRSLEPDPEFIGLVEEYAPETWERMRGEGETRRRELRRELAAAREEVAGLVRRLGRASDLVADELEREIVALKAREAEVERRLAKEAEDAPDYAEAWGRVSTWFRRPSELWKDGSQTTKNTVHRIVFTASPAFVLGEGFSTYDLTLPYQLSNEFKHNKTRVVDLSGESLHSVMGEIARWRTVLMPEFQKFLLSR